MTSDQAAWHQELRLIWACYKLTTGFVPPENSWPTTNPPSRSSRLYAALRRFLCALQGKDYAAWEPRQANWGQFLEEHIVADAPYVRVCAVGPVEVGDLVHWYRGR